jgi:hypothetical protein
MSLNLRYRVQDIPFSKSGLEIVEPKSQAFKEYVQSPTFEHAVKVSGETLGEIEKTVSTDSMHLQDRHRRSKATQQEQRIKGLCGEIAFAYLSEELELPVEWMKSDEDGYCGDALLMDSEACEDYVIEVKTAQMSSAGQNVPIRASYEGDDSPEEALRKEGRVPDLVVFCYVAYTGNEYVIGFEGVEPTSRELRGLLSREPRVMYDGELYLYDRKCIRHRIKDLDDLLLDKLRDN